MSYTKRLRKKALRAGATPGKALELQIQQELTRARIEWRDGDSNTLRTGRRQLKREIERAVDETFVCHKLLTIGFTHALPCNDYPQAMAAKLLPAKRRWISTNIVATAGVLSYPRSYVHERRMSLRQGSEDPAKWRRVIVSRFAIMSPSRLYVQVDMPGGMRKRLLRAPRGWHWKLRMLYTINPHAHEFDMHQQRYSQQVVLQSNSVDMKHAVVTAGMIVTEEGDVVRLLRNRATLHYDAYADQQRVARIREAAILARTRAAKQLRRTVITVSVRVFVAGKYREIRCRRVRGILSAYVYPRE